jgi:hypothetical protein
MKKEYIALVQITGNRFVLIFQGCIYWKITPFLSGREILANVICGKKEKGKEKNKKL